MASGGVRLILFGPRRLFPFFLRTACVAVALVEVWLSRGYLDPDGVSYSDLAKALLKGDWHNGLSSYWSPLYPFLLAIGYWIFRPGIHWQILVSHGINFLGFLASIVAWEWLLREWERSNGPPAQRPLVEAVGYTVIGWAGLHLVGLSFTSADMEVLALTIALGALLLRFASGRAQTSDFIWIGVALGAAFLAKAATLFLIPMILLELAILCRKSLRMVCLSAGIACLVALPFIVGLSIAKGRFAINDSGRLNYSWEVTGMSVEGYKDSVHSPGSDACHPITRVLDAPRVLGYETHLVGTIPIHFDPAWWCEGYPARLNLARQMMVLRSNVGYSVTRFAMCPALWFSILCCLSGAALPMVRRFASLWYIWLPALVVVGVYCLVVTLHRYLAGSFALIAFCLIAAGWNVRMPRWISAAAPAAVLLIFGAAFRGDVLQGTRAMIDAVRGREDPLVEAEIRIADTMRQQGFRAGDEVGLVGNTLLASWLHLLNGRSVAAVPMAITHDERIMGRPQVFKFEESHAFWRADRQTQLRVLEAFRSEGARWVFASDVPIWADVSGWQVAGDFVKWSGESRPFMYFRRLY